MKIKIENFQSIEKVEFEIKEGEFTCVVGPSNIGKSSLRRALECLFFNNSDDSYIRKGAKECSVEATLEGGMTLRWARNSKTAYYEVNGESYSKLGKTVPEPIVQAGFRELTLGKDKLNVQIASQFNNIFLLNENGSKVTEVFSNLGNLQKIINSNKLCQSDLKQNKSELRVRKQDLKVLSSKIDTFTGLDIQLKKFESIKKEYADLKKEKEKIDQVSELYGSLLSHKKLCLEYRKSEGVSVPEDDLEIKDLKKLEIYNKKYELLNDNKNAYSNLKDITITELELDTTLEDIKSLHSLLAKIERAKTSYASSKEALELSEVSELDYDTKDIEKLSNLSKRLEIQKNNILDVRKDIKEVSGEIERLTEDHEKLMAELDVCPFCDQDLKSNKNGKVADVQYNHVH